ncbi:MAG: PAS domain-containing protein, partial [Chitinophagaceae bacterium]
MKRQGRTSETDNYPFLQGGGEMGQLTRDFPWSQTPIGPPDQWPENLRLTVAMILGSRFPMFLWWGDELIQFYNDAYRPSLGNDGKHPQALGQRGPECWTEIWDIIYPLIHQVRTTGEATWSEDQLIPIYRNGHLEDVYWTFSYSPIRNADGIVQGVLVVCQETTEKVKAAGRLLQSEKRFRNLVSGAMMATAIFTGRDMRLELANDAMLKIWGRDKAVTGTPLLAFMPELEEQGFPQILDDVFTTGREYTAQEALVYLERNGKRDEVYMDFSYKPLRDDDQVITGILVMAADVTERVLSSKRLAQSEENLRNTILRAPVAMCIFRGPRHRVEIANDRMIELWGRPAAAVLGNPVFEAVPEVKNQGFEEILTAVFTTGNTYSAEGVPVTLLRQGGIEVVYINLVNEAYRESDGRITGVISVATDVTRQVIASKKIEESEQRVRSLVESAPFPIGVYVGREMRIRLANQAIMDVWGKGSDLVGKRYSDVLPELDSQAIYPQLDGVYTTGIPFHARNQRVDLVVDGRLQSFYFNYSFTPLHDADGKVYGVMNTAADVTDLNLAKQKVEQSERNFRSMVLQAPVAMCIMLGPQHVVEVANELMIELWGKPRADVMSKPIFEALPDAREQGLEQLLDNVYTTGETFKADERPVVLLRNGRLETVYQNFVYEPYKDADGTILGVLAISIDVTAQVLARQKIEDVVAGRTQELAAANASLQKSNAELEQFAYIASHDLQEPIRKVSTFAQMLEMNLGTIDARSGNYLNKIKDSSARMLSLIRDVLAYSQLSTNDEAFVQTSLAGIVKEVNTDLELLIDQTNARIYYSHLPEIEAIPLQMLQLFGNLISNALKFTRPGISPEITITSGIPGTEEIQQYPALNHLAGTRYHKIEVADNGIGFDPENAERIFHIFQRLHAREEYAGTGIGLAMCKKIVQNHNGYIHARSAKGSGTTFCIILPQYQPGREQPEPTG